MTFEWINWQSYDKKVSWYHCNRWFIWQIIKAFRVNNSILYKLTITLCLIRYRSQLIYCRSCFHLCKDCRFPELLKAWETAAVAWTCLTLPLNPDNLTSDMLLLLLMAKEGTWSSLLPTLSLPDWSVSCVLVIRLLSIDLDLFLFFPRMIRILMIMCGKW